MKHVDDGFLAQVTELYRQRIPAGGAVLDLGASHVSHLPPDVEYTQVVGAGMNAAEARAVRAEGGVVLSAPCATPVVSQLLTQRLDAAGAQPASDVVLRARPECGAAWLGCT